MASVISDHARADELLSLLIGKIVRRYQGLSASFSFALAISDRGNVSEDFTPRRDAWKLAMRKAFETGTDESAELDALLSAIDRVRHMRDALVHGEPRVELDDATHVVCRMKASRKRYLDSFVSHIRRTMPREHRSRLAVSAKLAAKAGSFVLDVSFNLKDVAQVADEIDGIAMRVRKLSGSAFRLRVHAMTQPPSIAPHPV